MIFLAPVEHAIESNVLLATLAMIAAFIVLAKCADLFVDSAVGLAWHLRVPKLVIGIVLVSLATTAPELSVSLLAALRGNPEMALGNAIGSVICDDGLALGLAGVLAATPILILPVVLWTSSVFLIAVEALLLLFVVFDHTLSRWEGVTLVMLFAGYLVLLYRQHKDGHFAEDPQNGAPLRHAGLFRLVALFALGLAGIVISSEFIVTSATTLAAAAGIPEAVIALTLVALGTSIPEVATCVAAARKNEGAIAVGNILGADILNICWVAGASSIANDLTLGVREIRFMYPTMFVVVGAMLLMLRHKYRLSRSNGYALLGLYIAYIAFAAYFYVLTPQPL
jgi:cation:H+ antiporter